MYHHIKNLMYSVHGGTPDPKFGNMLLEQFSNAVLVSRLELRRPQS
jgi:Mn-containing catalase